MNADHERLKAVLAEAAAQANPAERAVYLDDACRGDPEFRARVEALLRAHDRAGGFLEEPVVTTPPKNQVVSPGLTEKPGDWIGRDIKPSNILVTLHDGVPMPVVIDFGIAKATALQPLTDKTLFTAFEQFIGTPAYMSPEQAELSRLDIDTRSETSFSTSCELRPTFVWSRIPIRRKATARSPPNSPAGTPSLAGRNGIPRNTWRIHPGNRCWIRPRSRPRTPDRLRPARSIANGGQR